MLSVIYVSVADPLVRDADIAAILTSARRNNARDELTGALIYNGFNFMQALEGPDEKVEACLAIIRADARHSGMVELRRRTIETRTFAEWSMLYDPSFQGHDHDLSRLAANGHLDQQDERLMGNFLALGRRRPAA
ncbi:BLUF domain-containing protein [Sphingopyxis sp.]|uniref:BLUF domain-containing protein n=1 Tax=Sphingopyxis sp. TaxID=1908224 RepID=UPI003D139981